MLAVRRAAVAGQFYPDDPYELERDVAGFIEEGREHHPHIESQVKAIIVPHAGYQFSGPIAGTAYAQFESVADSIRHVVLVGPSHHVGFAGLAVCEAESFQTPLGNIEIDTRSVHKILALPQVRLIDEAHVTEHSLEVQLPFLQVVLTTDWTLTPIAVGRASTDEVTEVLDAVWGGPETVIVVSSDLSHYYDYQAARTIDSETTRLIENMQSDRIEPERACGCTGIRGLLTAAKRRNLRVTTLDVRNSGDTSGLRDQVVGYGAYAIHQ